MSNMSYIYITGVQRLRSCWLAAAAHGGSGGRDDPKQQLPEALWLKQVRCLQQCCRVVWKVLPADLQLLSPEQRGQAYKLRFLGGNLAAVCGGLNQSLYLGRSRTGFATKACATIGERKNMLSTLFFPLKSLYTCMEASQPPSEGAGSVL